MPEEKKAPQKIISWRPIESSNLTEKDEQAIHRVADNAIILAKQITTPEQREKILKEKEAGFSVEVGRQADFDKMENIEIPDEDIQITSADGKYCVRRIKWSSGKVTTDLQIISGGLVTKIDVPEGFDPQEAVETAQASDEFEEMLAKRFLNSSDQKLKDIVEEISVKR